VAAWGGLAAAGGRGRAGLRRALAAGEGRAGEGQGRAQGGRAVAAAGPAAEEPRPLALEGDAWAAEAAPQEQRAPRTAAPPALPALPPRACGAVAGALLPAGAVGGVRAAPPQRPLAGLSAANVAACGPAPARTGRSPPPRAAACCAHARALAPVAAPPPCRLHGAAEVLHVASPSLGSLPSLPADARATPSASLAWSPPSVSAAALANVVAASGLTEAVSRALSGLPRRQELSAQLLEYARDQLAQTFRRRRLLHAALAGLTALRRKGLSHVARVGKRGLVGGKRLRR
jgi:hypothetical protein